MPRFLAASTVALAAACLLALFATTSRATGESCARAGYAHAGVARAVGSTGVAATITPLRTPEVRSGHVAAWVGVGDRATRRWLQVGVVAYPGRPARVYVETARAPAPRAYRELPTPARPGLRVAVLAVGPGRWRPYVDDRPVGPAVALAGTASGAPAYVTTESWSAGRAACNRFAYRFDAVGFTAPRRGWTPEFTHELRPPGARLALLPSGFLAAA